MFSEMGLNSTGGLSNNTNGMPKHIRPIMDSALVAMAMMNGLTSAIVNPNDLRLMETIKSCDVFKSNTLYADSYQINNYGCLCLRVRPLGLESALLGFKKRGGGLFFKVTFFIKGGGVGETFANEGDNLLEVARECQCGDRCPCSDNGACGKCRVQLKAENWTPKNTSYF